LTSLTEEEIADRRKIVDRIFVREIFESTRGERENGDSYTTKSYKSYIAQHILQDEQHM
jgi:hypothetical protein